jgi:hypothetical protein
VELPVLEAQAVEALEDKTVWEPQVQRILVAVVVAAMQTPALLVVPGS